MEEINFQSARQHCEDNAESLVCSLRYFVFVFINVCEDLRIRWTRGW